MAVQAVAICFNYITAGDERETERDQERALESDPSAGYFLSALIHIRVLFTDVHFQLISLNIFMVFLSSSSITKNEDSFVSGSVKKWFIVKADQILNYFTCITQSELKMILEM